MYHCHEFCIMHFMNSTKKQDDKKMYKHRIKENLLDNESTIVFGKWTIIVTQPLLHLVSSSEHNELPADCSL